MIAIALTAEKMLADEPDSDKLHAHPHMVASVLKNGSWEHDDLTQQLWAGLLVTSCNLEDGSDVSNYGIYRADGADDDESGTHPGGRMQRDLRTLVGQTGWPPATIVITPEEMVRINGKYDLYRSATDVAYLNVHGLVVKNFDFSTLTALKKSFDITPTELGLKLFKACQGTPCPNRRFYR